MNSLSNLKLLRADMLEKKENFDIFDFVYRDKNYFVIVEIFDQKDKLKYTIAKLIFLRSEDITDKFEAWADSKSLHRKPYDIKNYFGIPNFESGIHSALEEFYGLLGKRIPTKFTDGKKNATKKRTLIDYLVSSDPEDPNKKYCIGVRRTGGVRSQFNDEKTKLLRSALYGALGKYGEVSFLYSDDKDKENDDATIIRNFEKNRT